VNIDKIYKPLERKIITDGVHVVGIEVYDLEDVQKLEEKYKELLGEHINLVKGLIEDFYCDGTDYECIPLCEKLIGMKWEDIINEN